MKKTIVLGLSPFEFSQTSGKPLDEVHRMIRDGKLEAIDSNYGRNILVTFTWFENDPN